MLGLFDASFIKSIDFEDYLKCNRQHIFGSILLNYTEDDFAWYVLFMLYKDMYDVLHYLNNFHKSV